MSESVIEMLGRLAPLLTQPTFRSFVTMVTGWALARRPGTVSAAIAAAGTGAQKHFSAYYRFFGRAVWSTDALGLFVLRLVLPLVSEETIEIIADDTLARKGGKHIDGAGVHHDPLGWTKRALAFGHNWVVLAVVVRVPLVGRAVAVPILWRLYRSKKKRFGRKGPKTSADVEAKTRGVATGESYRTRPELVVEMLRVLRGFLGEDRPLRLLGDSAYGGQSVSANLSRATHLVSRLTGKAGLYEPPPPRAPGGKGRPKKKGARLPSPEEMARTSEGRLPVKPTLYGKKVRVLVKIVDALWYGSCKTRLLRVVVTRDPSGRRKDDYFFTTDLTMTPVALLESYSRRWSLEVAFRDMKQELGLERPQSRSKQAVARTVPFIAAVYGLVVAWFARSGHGKYPGLFTIMSWYRHKEGPSFADMLRTFRHDLLASRFSSPPDHDQGTENLRKALEGLLLCAA